MLKEVDMKLQFETKSEMPMFLIKGTFYKEKTFPSLNNYLTECGKNPRAGGRLKKDYMMIASNAIRLQLGRYKTRNPIILHYKFYEPNRGQIRDCLNVFSFADKVVEDALQACDVIPNDNPQYVKNATHDFFYTDGVPYIEVFIEELERFE